MVAEKSIEKTLKDECQKQGWHCWKYDSSGTNGVPDRVITGRRSSGSSMVVFVELKQSRGVLSAEQRAIHELLRRDGAEVYVIKSKEQVFELIEELKYD